jgi:hypothetical protein
VRKPVLGRGLGRLMHPPATAAETTQPQSTVVTPGLKILIRGTETVSTPVSVPPPAVPEPQPEPVATEEAAPPQVAERRPWVVVAAFTLALVDVLLVAWPLVWVLKHPGHVSVLALVGCAVSVMIAGWAGAVAVMVWNEE